MICSSKTSWVRWGSLFVVLMLAGFATALMGCDDHLFIPESRIDVSPTQIPFESQKRDDYTKEVVVRNDSTTGLLEVNELIFTDSNDNKLDIASVASFTDQSVDLATANLPSVTQTTTLPISYLDFGQGKITNITCKGDKECRDNITPQFLCDKNPLDPDASGKICIGYYRWFNNTPQTSGGEANWREANWKIDTEETCSTDEDCEDSTVRAANTCDPTSKKCVSDISMKFSIDLAFERLVSLDDSSFRNKDLAATWTGINKIGETQAFCPKNTTQPATLRGLNRCDQVYLKRLFGSIHDNDMTTSVRLFPERQANFTIMVSPSGAGQSADYTLCKDGVAQTSTTIREANAFLVDPPALDGKSCVNGNGEIDESLLSIDTENFRIVELPVRIIYRKDDTRPINTVLQGKSFNMKVEHSATVDSFARSVTLSFPGNSGLPPRPIICGPGKFPNSTVTDEERAAVCPPLAPEEAQVEPLDDPIHLDARFSESPMGDDRKPFQFYWEWVPEGKPAFAQDVVLISSNGSFENPVPVTDKWSDETNGGNPKIYFTVSGTYKLRLKVRDSSGLESGPNEDCPTCPEYDQIDIEVKSSKKIHVELLWNRGGTKDEKTKKVDYDIFLVRQREGGTFGVSKAFVGTDRLQPPSPDTMPSCANDTDCYGGLLTCDAGFCKNTCTTDAQCEAVSPGWYCDEGQGRCLCYGYDTTLTTPASGCYLPCNEDSECGANKYCNLAIFPGEGAKMLCSKNPYDATNDTCFYSNRDPRWGNYSNASRECSDDTECNGLCDPSDPGLEFTCSEDGYFSEFACGGASCDFSCSSSSQCISASDQYLCIGGSCQGNEVDDDPTLDIDDVDGWGPENISLKKPHNGIYRVVARLYTVGSEVQMDPSKGGPNAPIKGFFQIFLNGNLMFEEGMAHEFTSHSTYWKVADIHWNPASMNDFQHCSETLDDVGCIKPICAGWTMTRCDRENDQCADWYAEGYSCQGRTWGKYCSTCTDTAGVANPPDECNPTSKACTSDADCAGEETSKTCATIQADYCRCTDQQDEYHGNFEDNPYANPFYTSTQSTVFNPQDPDIPRSIWCDDPQTEYDAGASCGSLY